MSVLESTGALRPRWAWLRALSDTPIVVILASVFMGVMLFVMIFAQWIQPYDFDHIDLRSRMTPPVPLNGSSLAHPMGTDKLGRDLFSRLVIGAQTSLLLALLGTVLGAV